MLTVSDDPVRVEFDLAAGCLCCPGCGGVLRRWGWARARSIREGEAASPRRVRPRRARCVGCRVTHVLLSAELAARRADAAEVIAAAIAAKAVDGQGHRPIAARLGRPVSTVRGWLRLFAASAVEIATAFGALLARDAGDAAAIWPAPTTSATSRAVAAVAAYAQMLNNRWRIGNLPWHRVGLSVAGPWLFSSCWCSRRGQHQLALTPGPLVPGG